MKIISIESQTFEEMMEKFNAFTQKVDSICDRHRDKTLQDWMDDQDVCTILNISKQKITTNLSGLWNTALHTNWAQNVL